MAIQAACPKCGKRWSAGDAARGRTMPCPACKALVQLASPAPGAVETMLRLRQQGDAAMSAGRLDEAQQCFLDAWQLILIDGTTLGTLGITRAFWLLMSALDAQFRRASYAEAFETLRVALPMFEPLVIGNPYFHLRAGQIKVELGVDPGDHGAGSAVDELARALIGGGVDLFNGEHPKYLALIERILKPPHGYSSWAQTAGRDLASTRDMLNGAEGFLRDALAWKFSKPPPYR